jgi:5'-nucleotidase
LLDGRITVVAAAAKPADTAAADVKTPELPAASNDLANKAPEVKTEPVANAEPTTAPAQTTETRHVIVSGDTFWDLAKTFYGDGAAWRKIADANKDMRARRLHIGAELTVPAK